MAALAERQKDGYDYHDIDSLQRFEGTHPAVMHGRIERKNWAFDFDISRKKFKGFKRRLLYWIEQNTGKRLFDYRNYKVI